ncbi:hypothetical protein ACQPZX_16250 [Actinoplanes sp. CA-142083]|uniref:hypothetical protein n=1 Tax=Actinoplanes sp. CA-142083 TaxID=3239903 RepID=UPI003D8F6961
MAASSARRKSDLKVPAAAAFVVLAAGFGALCLFWTSGVHPSSLPGLFDFASATWGDALALPAMTGFLLYAVRALPAARGDRPFALVTAVLAGALGLASQALWLAAGNPRPNWTLPRPHRFTAAGWYHAAFVTAMCAVTAALLALALNRITLASRRPRPVVAAIAAGIACGLVFIALLAADSGATPGGAGLAGVLLALVALIAVGGTVIARRVAPR